MTANEMAYRFKVLYDKITKFQAEGYNDREISEVLNIAQLELVKLYYNPYANKYKKGFEHDEKRRKDLSSLVRNVYLYHANMSTNQTDVHKKGIMYDLPTDMWLATQEECDIDIYNDTCQTISLKTDPKTGFPILTGLDWDRVTLVPVKPVVHDEYNLNIDNPFKKPYEELIWRLDIENTSSTVKRHELINYTGATILRYRIRYIKFPVKIVVDNTTPLNQAHCELVETMHDEIIRRAVEIATGITVPEEYQIKSIETLKTE